MKTGVNTGSDYLPYDLALAKGIELISQTEPQKRIIGLYIVVSINLGLRISDILQLTWSQLRQDEFTIKERKTGKQRTLAVNHHIKNAVNLFDANATGYIFVSQKGCVYAVQSINVLLKEVFKKESEKLNISSHSLRKTMGRHVYDKLGKSEDALVFLSEIYNHTSLRVTRIYLGLRQQEINNIYHLL